MSISPAAAPNFKTGQQLGPYVLVRELGRGSFAVVWLGERRAQLSTTQVALKFPRGADIDVEAIRKEADVWVKASGHPNVIPVYEAEIYDGQVVIVSEYAPEGTLEQWLARSGGSAPNLDSAVTMGTAILAGLHHLHARGVLHRDLKPANILLQGNLPRITDFGLARVLQSATASHDIAGSPAYMAPEVWDGERQVESDLWAVGVILYELLAGRQPFAATNVDALRKSIQRDDPPELPPRIPQHMRGTIKKVLAKPISERFHSAEEMAAALTGKAAELATAAYEPPLTANPLLNDQVNQLVADLRLASPKVRADAVRQLGKLGGRGGDALTIIKILSDACADPSPLVQAAIVKAFQEIIQDRPERGLLLQQQIAMHLRQKGTPEARKYLERLGLQ